MANKTRTRYKNDFFLKTLGNHCRMLRQQRGLSIDRLAKESQQLSAGTIDRLERGLSDSQTLVLVRYAEALGVTLLDLFSFLKDTPELSNDSRIIPYEEDTQPPPKYVPVFPIKVAAGKFSSESTTYQETHPLGWIDANLKTDSLDYFATFVKGDSMLPKIKDGDLCLFKKYTGGSRQGHTFLIQARGLKNSETGESYVVKKYMRITPQRVSAEDSPSIIHLVSENSKYPPIILMGTTDDEVQVLAEFIRVL